MIRHHESNHDVEARTGVHHELLTVPLCAFGKQEDQQLPDEPNPGRERDFNVSFRLSIQSSHVPSSAVLTVQGRGRTAVPLPACAPSVLAGTCSMPSKRSTSTAPRSKGSTGQPIAAHTQTRGGSEKWARFQVHKCNNLVCFWCLHLLQPLVFGSKLLQLFNVLP